MAVLETMNIFGIFTQILHIFVEYINKEGNHINESWVLNRHNDGHAFSEGLADVADYNHNSKHKLWGYINYNGETIYRKTI